MLIKNCLFLCLLICNYSIIYAGQLLQDGDIKQIYNLYVKPNLNHEYRFRYKSLPLNKNPKFWPWENKDLPRVIATLEFERFTKTNHISCQKGLAINGIDPEWHYLKAAKIVTINYADDPEKYDLHNLDLPEKDFDFAICCQTLEHVYDPVSCVKNIYKHIKPGGILYLQVPGNNIPHSTPFHFYTGFTATGIGAIVQTAGFKILSIGHWGNLKYQKIMHETNSWPDYKIFKGAAINDLECSPMITWVFACK